jgi:hypothetical protein
MKELGYRIDNRIWTSGTELPELKIFKKGYNF